MFLESYTHTRNYGCRLRRFFWNGVEMLSLENSRLKAVVALGKGADIVELLYKPLDVDFMWHSFNPLSTGRTQSVASPDGSFLDVYSGGWQELFPTYGGRTLYHGAHLGVHGEACLYPWACDVVTDEPEEVAVTLSLRMQRTPFKLEKTLRLTGDRPALQIRETVVNEGTTEQAFLWGQHPAFGVPFLDGSVRIRFPGSPEVTAPADIPGNRKFFGGDVSGLWPFLADREGKPVDLSRVCGPDAKRCTEFLVRKLPQGSCEIVNHSLGLGLRMTWDREVFPYVWIWANYAGEEGYPWYGRAYTLAVEPWSTVPGDYERAVQTGGRLLTLGPNERMETELCTEAFVEPDAGCGE